MESPNPKFALIRGANECVRTNALLLLLSEVWVRILSPRLENNYSLNCGSDNFPTYPHLSGELNSCWSNSSMYCCFPIQGTSSGVLLKVAGQIYPIVFLPFWALSHELENNNNLISWSKIFQLFCYIWLCWKIIGTKFQCSVVLQSRRQTECKKKLASIPLSLY